MGTTYYGVHHGIALIDGFADKNPVQIALGATVTRGADAHGDAVYGAFYAWNIDNFGTIAADGAAGYGIALTAGGSIVDATGARVEGGRGGVYIAGGSGGVLNFGTIAAGSATGPGVRITGDGDVANGEPGAAISVIAGGLSIDGTGTVTNFGTVAAGVAAAVSVGSDGSAAADQVINLGRIDGAVQVAAGSMTNVGVVTGSASVGGTLVNFGTIGGGAIIGGSAGVLVNGQSGAAIGLIEGGASLIGGAATVDNWGTVTGDVGIAVAGPRGTLTNDGAVAGDSGTAIAFAGGGALLITYPDAVFAGIVAAGGAGNRLELSAGADTGGPVALGSNFAGFGRVAVDPGATWLISGAGSRFTNDGTVIVDGALVFAALGGHGTVEIGAGSLAEFAGPAARAETILFTDTAAAAQIDRPQGFHAVVAGFGPGDTLDLTARTADALSFAGHGLTVTQAGSVVATLAFAGAYTAADFALSPDGGGGTDITFAGLPAEFWTMRG